MLTVDASVFVAAARPVEVNHLASLDFVGRLSRPATSLYEPTLALAETAAALARATSDLSLISVALAGIEILPRLVLVDLTADRSRHAAQLATTYRLRGADSIYLQVAVEFGATLVTWDTEMLTRVPPAVTSITPSDWLSANPISPTEE